MSCRVEGVWGNREVPPENGGAAARREGGSWGKQGFFENCLRDRLKPVPEALSQEPEAREAA
jgi:hypothetical protein